MIETRTVAAVGQRLNVLRARFLRELPHRISALDRALASASAGEAARDGVLRHFHTLAGTASTYGIVRVAALADEAEQICTTSALDQQTVDYLHILLSDLRREAFAASAHHDAA